MSLVDNSLLVYTADNTLHHYLIIPTEESIKLHLCGSISFEGVIAAPSAVRVLSWMIPSAQKRAPFLCFFVSRPEFLISLVELGDPMNDLSVATVLMIVGGRLVLLKPRKVCHYAQEVDSCLLQAISPATKKLRTICKYWPTGSSSAGYICAVSVLWRTPFGAMTGRKSVCG